MNQMRGTIKEEPIKLNKYSGHRTLFNPILQSVHKNVW